MQKKYNENNIFKQLADSIMEAFHELSKKLSYTKGYIGVVTAKEDEYYTITIKGIEKKIKTDYPLNIGEQVILLSLQNQISDYVVLPNYKQIHRV